MRRATHATTPTLLIVNIILSPPVPPSWYDTKKGLSKCKFGAPDRRVEGRDTE